MVVENVGKTKLAEGYSFTGGKGKVLVDTISYGGGSTYEGGTFNVYKDAPKEETKPQVEQEVQEQEPVVQQQEQQQQTLKLRPAIL